MKTLNFSLVLALALSIPLIAQEDVTQLEANAKRGDPTAQYLLGVRYSKGQGVRMDRIEAYKWFHLAVEGGNRKAVMARYEVALGMSQA
jgi:TPR repeat protein